MTVVPGALVVVFAFSSGGYFAPATAWGIVLLAGLLAIRVASARGVGARRTRSSAVAAAVLLTLLAGWILLSAAWSGAPRPAIVEADRALLYMLALTLLASLALSPTRVRAVTYGVAVAIVAVCAAALAARLLPDVWPLAADLDRYGLAYPVSYANALGALAMLGGLLCLHLAGDPRARAGARVLGAAAVPLLAATLWLSGSHGAAAAGAIGVVVYLLAARPDPRTLASVALATVAPAAAVLVAAADEPVLAGADATSAAAVAAGLGLAIVIALATGGAALVRLLLGGWERRRTASPRGGATAVALACALAIALVVAGGLIVGASDGPTTGAGAAGSRASSVPQPGFDARRDHWRVALAAFAEAPLAGHGAGTYAQLNRRARGADRGVRDAHSLPLETLAELGLVGFALLGGAVGALVVGLVRELRRETGARGLVAVVLALTVAWAVHASIDWDWEMPVVTLPVLALCGAVLGARGCPEPSAKPREAGWRAGAARAAITVALVALVAWAVSVAVTS